MDLLLENDITEEKVIVNPWLSSHPCLPNGSDQVMQDIPGLYPACAVTRSMAKKAEKLPPLESDGQAVNQSSEKSSALEPTPLAESIDNRDDNLDLSTTFLGMTDSPGADSMEKEPVQNDASLPPIPTQELIMQQESDPQEVLCEDEAAKVPTCFYMKSGVLMRKWKTPTAPVKMNGK